MKFSFFILSLLLSAEVFAIDKNCNGAPTLPHVNGGGKVAITASVSATAYVGPNASVCEYAMVFGASEVRDNARVYGLARLNDGSIVSGDANVFGNTILSPSLPSVITVTDNSYVYGNAKLLGGVTTKGNSKIFENARISLNAIVDENSSIYGNATITDNAIMKGNSKIHGRAFIGGNVVAIDGAIVCEGRYFETGTTLNSLICKAPSSGLLATQQIVTGDSHACSMYATGRVRCWGYAVNGKLGYGNTNNIGDNEAPSSTVFVSIGGAATQVVAGSTFTCALLSSGMIRCWGSGTYGEIGNGSFAAVGDDELPSSALPVFLGDIATQITAGGQHACAILPTGSIRCWGRGDSGQLGYSGTGPINNPSTIGNINVGGVVTQIDGGASHTCALLNTGNVRCWGLASSGQLGYGNTNNIGDNEAPSSAGDVNVGGTVIQVAAGTSHTCALLNTGNVRCWGLGSSGQLGYGNTNTIGDNEAPASAGDVSVGGIVTQITAGSNHTCALLNTGSVRCWGSGLAGALGYGNLNTIGDNETPMMIGDIDLGEIATQIDAGSSFTCAKLVSGRVRCWGSNIQGQLGYGNTNNIGDNETPSSVGDILNFTSTEDFIQKITTGFKYE